MKVGASEHIYALLSNFQSATDEFKQQHFVQDYLNKQVWER